MKIQHAHYKLKTLGLKQAKGLSEINDHTTCGKINISFKYQSENAGIKKTYNMLNI